MNSEKRKTFPPVKNEGLPHDELAEQTVLGDIMTDPEAIGKIPFLKQEDFYSTKNMKIYAAAIDIHGSGTTVDLLTLNNEISRRGQSNETGGIYYLTQLAEGYVSSANIQSHAGIVKEKSIQRERILCASKILENSRNGADELMHVGLLTKLNEMNLTSVNRPIELSSLPKPELKSFVVEDILPEGFPSNLYGDSGQGKSLVALRIGASIITGRPFLGKNVKCGPVLYIDCELDQHIQTLRWWQISMGMNFNTPIEGLYYRRMTKLFHAELPNIQTWVKEINPALTIIDSVGKALADDPLDPVSAIKMYTACEKLGTVLLIDHQAKPGADGNYSSRSEFGSSYKRNLARSSWQLQCLSSSGRNSGYVIRQKKNNFGPLSRDLNFEINFNPEAISFISVTGSDSANRPLGVRSSITSVLQKRKATSAQIFESIGGSFDLGAIRNELSTLQKEGFVIVIAKQGNSNLYGLSASQSSP